MVLHLKGHWCCGIGQLVGVSDVTVSVAHIVVSISSSKLSEGTCSLGY